MSRLELVTDDIDYDGAIALARTFRNLEWNARAVRVVIDKALGSRIPLDPGIRICTCLMSEGIHWEDDNEMHNSWCDGLTDHRWIRVDAALGNTEDTPKVT